MNGYQVSFERGFMIHYPDALGANKGIVFAFHRSGERNRWDAYLDTDGEIQECDLVAPPCLYLPDGAIGRAWHGQRLEETLGFALDEKAEKFDGDCHREADGWAVVDTYGRILVLLERNNAPAEWVWAEVINELKSA